VWIAFSLPVFSFRLLPTYLLHLVLPPVPNKFPSCHFPNSKFLGFFQSMFPPFDLLQHTTLRSHSPRSTISLWPFLFRKQSLDLCLIYPHLSLALPPPLFLILNPFQPFGNCPPHLSLCPGYIFRTKLRKSDSFPFSFLRLFSFSFPPPWNHLMWINVG